LINSGMAEGNERVTSSFKLHLLQLISDAFHGFARQFPVGYLVGHWQSFIKSSV
jgi:hypothetical protein